LNDTIGICRSKNVEESKHITEAIKLWKRKNRRKNRKPKKGKKGVITLPFDDT